MVVSINGKRVVEVIATMQQSNKSLPIQLVSSKNNYKNELMSPKQNSYFYDTMAAQNPQKYIFESSNCTVDGHNEYKTMSLTKDIFFMSHSCTCSKIDVCNFFIFNSMLQTLGPGACSYFTIGNKVQNLPLFVWVDHGGW